MLNGISGLPYIYVISMHGYCMDIPAIIHLIILSIQCPRNVHAWTLYGHSSNISPNHIVHTISRECPYMDIVWIFLEYFTYKHNRVSCPYNVHGISMHGHQKNIYQSFMNNEHVQCRNLFLYFTIHTDIRMSMHGYCVDIAQILHLYQGVCTSI